MQHDQEQQLLDWIREGNYDRDKLFSSLMKEYQERVYYHVRRIVIDHDDANDVVQNTFIKVWKNIDSFRAESGFFTWIYRIATNESLNLLKKKSRRFFLPLNDYEHQLEQKLDQSDFDGDELQKELQKAILKLPEKQRVVFNMKYFDELKYEQMSKILGTSEGALKASYHHAVKKIEKHMLATLND